MQKTLKSLVVLCIVVLLSSFAYSNASAITMSSYDSVINVSQATTDLGGGSWQYDLSFTNTDTSNIWHFMVWTDASASNIAGSLTSWDNGHAVPADVDAAYDARNIDPGIVYAAHMWEGSWGGAGGSQVGDAETFSFVTSYYTDSLLYGYETGKSGWDPQDGGYLAAVGRTAPVPEPGTLLLLGSGLTGLAFVKRRFSK